MINIATATKTNENTIHDWSMVIDNMTKVINPMIDVARDPGCPYCRHGKYFGSGDCYHRIDVDCDDNPAICTHFQDGEDFNFGVEFAARIYYCPMCGRKLSGVA